MKRYKILLPLFITLLSNTLAADELEDSLSGFDDTAPPAAKDSTAVANTSLPDDPPASYTLNGYTALFSAYNYASKNAAVSLGDTPMDFSGLSRVKAKGGLSLEMKHGENWRSKIEALAWYDASWAINGKDNYTDDVLDTYETFIYLKDAYIQGSLTPHLDLKFGRQIVIWGKSDSIRITDIINPLDNRNPGIGDIEDLRLNETMTRLDYYVGNWALSSIIIHEPRLDIEAEFGSDYRPSDAFGSPIPYAKFPDRLEPHLNLENTQYAISLDGRFTGWDLSYYAAQVYSNRFDITAINNSLLRTFNKINMLGLASNVVYGSWLFKAEAAYINDINYRSTNNKNRLDALIGFDYMGKKDVLISLEIANRHIFNYEDKMHSMTLQEAIALNTFPDFVRQDSMQIALRTSFDFDHDNTTLTYLLSLMGGNGSGNNIDGGFQRLWVDYKYSDAISLSAGIIDYIGGDGTIPFYNAIENNDRAFVEIKTSF
ncbi:MAG: hypothetical protein JKY01_10430 [Pseudomonadales bacterium]|nr:hypothetical protein [Pseudomonadales bacterium]